LKERKLSRIVTRQLINGETMQEVVENLLNQPFPKPTEAAPQNEIPPALEAICLRALEKNAKDRYADVESLLDELRELRGNQGVL
jgi:hypothetical protein